MSSSIYLHKFHQGKEVAVSFEEVIGFLAKYGTPGVGRYVNEVTFAVNEIAELANVVGSEADGALCIAISRPLIDDQFRQFVFEAMQFFGFSAYEDAFDRAYVLRDGTNDLPHELLTELSHGIQEVTRAEQLWPCSGKSHPDNRERA
ncbi:hypothetical protein [Variovorax boronicumulans]|uniref:hypothetical protein n=1 Tax=Variovorax boronicumulans TaxID=436515 RepID=UPI00277D93B1|nr:hypothetical protein [Variovorax boronicumulans]MDQ0040190.1 hypothetical protein [Variovorax boronicumulans]